MTTALNMLTGADAAALAAVAVANGAAANDLSNVTPATGRAALGLAAISSPSDGVLTLLNNAKTDFGRLQIGGTTNAFPAITRLGATLMAVLADNSTYAPFTADRFRGGRGTLLVDPSDGIWRVSNNAGTDFGSLQFGGATSAFPALKRNGTGLQVRLADDSGLSNLDVNSLTATQVVKTTAYTVATLPSAVANGAGSRSFVSDATATTFNSAVAGGGANNVPVFSDGSAWRIG